MFGDAPIVVLRTVGARTGRERATPMLALHDEDGSRLVTASNAGRDPQPAWYHNLVARPAARLETAGHRDGEGFPVQATIARPDERDALSSRFVEMNPQFAHSETTTDRTIPVVRLTPVPPLVD